MKRWLLWCSLPPLLFAVTVLVAWYTGTAPRDAVLPLQLAVGVWLAITLVAAPLGIVIWLVRGRPRRSLDHD